MNKMKRIRRYLASQYCQYRAGKISREEMLRCSAMVDKFINSAYDKMTGRRVAQKYEACKLRYLPRRPRSGGRRRA